MDRLEGALAALAVVAFGVMLRFLYRMRTYERPGGGHDRYRAMVNRVRF